MCQRSMMENLVAQGNMMTMFEFCHKWWIGTAMKILGNECFKQKEAETWEGINAIEQE